MSWFRAKKLALEPAQERFAIFLAKRLLSLQKRLAAHLSLVTATWTIRLWKWVLTGFVALFGGYCFYLLWSGFTD